MTPEELQRLQAVEKAIADITATDRYTFQKKIQILDGRTIQVGKTTGTKIGLEATEKLGFFGKTPVVQQVVSSVAGGAVASDGVARAGVNAIVVALQALGLFQ
jgi:hypothetical protein